MDKKIREIKRDSHMVDGSQGQVAKVAALPSGPHCLHCHGDDEDDDIYIMMKCLSVCLSRKMITSSWESPVTT